MAFKTIVIIEGKEYTQIHQPETPEDFADALFGKPFTKLSLNERELVLAAKISDKIDQALRATLVNVAGAKTPEALVAISLAIQGEDDGELCKSYATAIQGAAGRRLRELTKSPIHRDPDEPLQRYRLSRLIDVTKSAHALIKAQEEEWAMC